MIKPRLGCYAVYEPGEEGWQDFEQKFAAINSLISSCEMEVVAAPEAVCDEASCQRVAQFFAGQKIDLLHALIISWSFDHYSFIIQQAKPVPVAIRSIPGIRSGSIVGGQQLGSLLTDLGIEHGLFYGALDSLDTVREIQVYARAWALKNSLKGARFAMLGRRTPGMTPIAVDEVEMMRLFGLVLTNIGMDEFDALAQRVAPSTVESTWHQIAARAMDVKCTPEDAMQTTRTYLGMKQLVKELGLAGITVGSYPACQGTACLPIALLNEEGNVAGCEGDMNATLLMYLLSQLSESPVHFGEMLDVNEKENTLITSHCGAAAPSLADGDGFTLGPVRLADCGVCIRFKARSGPVTFVNLVGRKANYRMCAFEGEALPTGMVFEGNPLKIKMKAPFRRIWKDVSSFGFGHHWMTAYNHVVPELAEFCRLTGVQGVFPDLQA